MGDFLEAIFKVPETPYGAIFKWYDCIELLLEAIFTVLETSSKTFPWYWRLLHCTRDNFEGCSWCWRLPHHPGDTFVTIFAVVET